MTGPFDDHGPTGADPAAGLSPRTLELIRALEALCREAALPDVEIFARVSEELRAGGLTGLLDERRRRATEVAWRLALGLPATDEPGEPTAEVEH